MRPRSAHAALSGVGEHTARESESAQCCAAGKERVANAHPHFEPGTARSRVHCFMSLPPGLTGTMHRETTNGHEETRMVGSGLLSGTYILITS